MRLRKQVSLFRQFFGSLEVVVFGEVVGPVEQGLPHDRADLGVVKLGSALEDLGDEVVPPAAVDAGAVPPPAHLSGVVLSSTPLNQ